MQGRIDASDGPAQEKTMFLPAGQKSTQLDQRMRSSLADSIDHLFQVVGGAQDLPDIAIEEVCANIRGHRLPPGLFARYYDLVLAVKSGRHEQVGSLFCEIAAMSFQAQRLSIVPLSEPALGSDAARYARILGGERFGAASFGPPSDMDWLGFEARTTEALRTLDEIDPDLAGEVRGLTAQIVGAVPSSDSDGFGSASSIMLWGATVANLRRHTTVVDVMAGLVHETAHQLLFGLSVDEPLVMNPIKERYASPLRKDPRPMDGIYHATFVCARLFYLFERITADQRGIFQDTYRVSVDEHLQDLRSRFLGGYETVVKFGRLSSAGEQVMADTSNYMKRAA